jgi:class 3 adenylate cyclase
MRLPAKDAADIVTNYFLQKQKLHDLVNTLISLDNTQFRGKTVILKDSVRLAKAVEECGFEYSANAKQLKISEKGGKRADFGFCKEGVEYDFAFVDIDIVKNSEVVNKFSYDIVKKTYTKIIAYFTNRIEKRDGRIWTWAGDGGIAAFYGDNKCVRAVNAAIDIVAGIPLFNAEHNNLPVDLNVRVAVHKGRCIYRENKDLLLSDDINFVVHLEKKFTHINSVSISENVFQELTDKHRRFFFPDGLFERRKAFRLKYDIGSQE